MKRRLDLWVNIQEGEREGVRDLWGEKAMKKEGGTTHMEQYVLIECQAKKRVKKKKKMNKKRQNKTKCISFCFVFYKNETFPLIKSSTKSS